ncbi:SGNH/GDSL hydrolase family protein [Oscillatoria sp. FACHB-1406]|uniref:SGNH/GDSL hydrolase family protein n=1 Tax=Oscillatoria sp. FACHB-1406 TaxID=2692846 RepID=UPI0016846C67|nr:SGNH/GDSL hydrolase family protein [Oscillatoria sp. FACHB-1406]MBD2577604.1 SGNH/GDSL hydrolase family protein [Oscillatoria sp. FACHB-1406]
MKVLTKWWIPAGAILGVVGLELFLSLAFGLGHPPLVVADRAMGYRFGENQRLRRFGNVLEYNQYSQRSEAIASPKPSKTLRILMVGDSVLNGGNRKDQSEIISELLEVRILRATHSGSSVEVLNASANSWGIGNHWGYLRKYGWFDSDAVILQIGTHDLIQETSKADPESLKRRPRFALEEAIAFYAWPILRERFRGRNPAPAGVERSQPNPTFRDRQFRENMAILEQIAAETRKRKIPLFVLYTPDRRDLLPTSTQPDYQGEFFKQLQGLKIPVIDSHAAWSKLPPETVANYFIDGVHLSVEGNRAIAELLFLQLCQQQQLPACQT